ncbi:hypothetical protein ABT160_24530 [Streptomyces sp. NPDC001941]|uniref:hypothetical protein n=1 Tax=Streptomyces sp. NPDC001941 TaxID=3154659 RepID=UPI00332093FE
MSIGGSVGDIVASAQHGTTLRTALDALTRLTGTEPRTTTDAHGVTVEIDVDAQLTARWQDLVDILDLATAYGMSTTRARSHVWLRFTEETPRP